MKSYFIILGVILCLVVAVSGCITPWSGSGSQGSGGNATGQTNVQGVTAVTLAGPGTLIVQQGDNESLTVEADDNLKQNINIVVTGNHLFITDRNSVSNGAVKFHLIVKNLDTITVGGLGEANVTSLNASKLTATVDVGKMTLVGKVSEFIATVNGGGDINAKDLESQTATVTINGGGSTTLRVVQTLKAIVNGGGSITYLGNPQVTQQINGMGKVTQSNG